MGKRKIVTVNTRSSGEHVEPHGGQDVKGLGPRGGNDQKTKRTQIELRPADADRFDESTRQPKSEK